MDISPWLLTAFERYGYLVVFVGVMVENAGIPFPGELTLLAAATLAAGGHFWLPGIMVVATLGAMCGDNAGYWLGRRIGRPFWERYGPYISLTPAKLATLEGFFARYGARTIIIARFFTGLRVFAALFAGLSHMHWRSFIFYNALGALLWAVSVASLGYAFGESWSVLQHWLGWSHLLVTLLGGVLLLILWHYTRTNKASRQQHPPDEMPSRKPGNSC